MIKLGANFNFLFTHNKMGKKKSCAGFQDMLSLPRKKCLRSTALKKKKLFSPYFID